MNPPLHPSQEGNLQPARTTKLPSSEGLGVGSWKDIHSSVSNIEDPSPNFEQSDHCVRELSDSMFDAGDWVFNPSQALRSCVVATQRQAELAAVPPNRNACVRGQDGIR